jgi:hypothetical protein
MGERSNEAKKFRKTFEISYEDFLKARFHAFLGIIEKFITEFGEEKVMPVVSEYMAETAVQSVKQATEDKVIENFAQFKVLYMQMINSEFMRNATTFEIVEDEEYVLEISYKKCLWAKIFHEFGVDFGYNVCCNVDYAVANAFHPNIKLTRTKTIMQGDKHCNHRYSWVEQ